MRSIGIAQIVLLFLFIVVPIINYILARKERQRQRRMESRRVTVQPPVETPARRTAQRQSAVAPEFVSSRAAAPPQPSARPHTARSRQALFRSKRDLRRTIIAMTILGPCRADEPHA